MFKADKELFCGKYFLKRVATPKSDICIRRNIFEKPLKSNLLS